ncbi:hypothetical protein KAFR_0C01220 [Kazachstania africana CBS 2517]|uniref:ATP synthase subunit K, mitochondrial n=1 Tax=Kazachstania africana (strain ATCC 22294 / BCRC 22015 / CBS 2517 / CECT 1963 / NBRC 1671 / NRRL Y-8276) TaxID=1071382 RepID=H2ARW7_KAZAF|nr:hypothetical protein KAFR_0C01220 [Kazachstania africana CBS 2517]CCF57117.1 hypothetical protein KAFR_0C01220 [Kazachstania africana CBS 2517]
MGNTYQIMGRAFQPHQLALATLGTVSLLILPSNFSSKSGKAAEIKADSKEEEDFIRNYISTHKGKESS